MHRCASCRPAAAERYKACCCERGDGLHPECSSFFFFYLSLTHTQREHSLMIQKHLTRSSISVQSAGPVVASSRAAASESMAAAAGREKGGPDSRLGLCKERQRKRGRGGGERGGWMRYNTFYSEVGPTVLSGSQKQWMDSSFVQL